MNLARLLAALAVPTAGLRLPCSTLVAHGDVDCVPTDEEGQAELWTQAQAGGPRGVSGLTPIEKVGQGQIELETDLKTEDDGEKLPNLTRFSSEWSELAKNNLSGHVPVFPEIRLVLGVFTTVNEAAYRSIIRSTWMHQAGICNAALGPALQCSVYVTFVQAGRINWPFDDLLELSITENMNYGKSFVYFRQAMFNFPWATHYGKMDTDVFPDLPVILQSIQRVQAGCESYLGKPWSCNYPAVCPSKTCGPPLHGNFRSYPNDTSNKCWSYMQGGLYILSHRLTRLVVAPGGYGEAHRIGPEDALMGAAVSHVAKDKDLCVSTWPQELWMGNVAYFHARRGAPCVNKVWCDSYAWPVPTLRPV